MFPDDNSISINDIKICLNDFMIEQFTDDNVSNVLIRKIEESGMSMAEFARRSGISESSIIRHKFDRVNPSLEMIVAYCIINLFVPFI